MNADTTVHLAHVQAFFYKLESLAGENIILLYLFGKKKKKVIITSRCLSNFIGPIVSYFSAVLNWMDKTNLKTMGKTMQK